MIELQLFKEVDLADYTLLEGFPGLGLVGPMTDSYIIEKLKMEYIGYIKSSSFPPIAAVHDSIPMFPVRIYRDEKYKVVIILSEFIIPPEVISQLAEEIINFVVKYNIKQIISIGGIPSQKPTNEVYAVSSDRKRVEEMESLGIKHIEEGVVAGVSGIILVEGMRRSIPVIDLLVQVNPSIMDPKYAELAIINLQKIINIEINTQELEEESKIVEARVREMLKNAKEGHEGYKNAINATGEGPSMYA